MKTEKEFSDYFTQSCPHDLKDHELVLQISKSYWKDLTSHLVGYFEYEARLDITQKAGHLLSQNLMALPKEEAWAQVIRNFSQNAGWSHRTISKKPKAKKTEEQLIFWKLFKYVWVFFQSMIILKTAVYFFGLESAQYPDQVSVHWVWFFFSISASSLIFFAYRNFGDKSN